jgi:GTPase
MRTAVVRVDVDPDGGLTPTRLTEGMAVLRALADEVGVKVVENNLAAMPVRRRQVELLITGSDTDEVVRVGIKMCAKAFGTTPAAGAVTFVSRGTDDDALGVLSGFGLTADIERLAGDDGWDVVYVTLRKSDLERVPESRIHTALEASLNCEVRILTK